MSDSIRNFDPNLLASIAKRAKISFNDGQTMPHNTIVNMSNTLSSIESVFNKISVYYDNITNINNAIQRRNAEIAKEAIMERSLPQKLGSVGPDIVSTIDELSAEIDQLKSKLKHSDSRDGIVSIISGGLGLGGLLGMGLGIGKKLASLKTLGLIGIGIDAYDRYEDGQGLGQIALGLGGGIAGTFAGQAAGNYLGGAVGSFFGVPAVGAAVGGVIGSVGGYVGGSKIADTLFDKYFSPKHATKNQPKDVTSTRFASYLGDTVNNVNQYMMALPFLLPAAAGVKEASGDGFLGGFNQAMNDANPAGSSEHATQAMNYFTSQGWTKAQAAGIVGNLQQESGRDLDPHAKNKIGMFGLAQWDTKRRAKFQSVFKKDIYSSSFEEQLQYIQYELSNSHLRAGNALKKATTAQEAAIAIEQYYEVSGGSALNKRIANANNLAGDDGIAKQVGQTVGGAVVAVGGFVASHLGSGTTKFAFPVAKVRITSPFGMRSLNGRTRMHAGIDLGASVPGRIGDPVYAAADGVVSHVGPAGGYGNLIIIEHEGGMSTRYGHLMQFRVAKGTHVRQGQLIGIMGSTGYSTGAHLHFEIRRNGQAINPISYLGGSSRVSPDANATEPGAEVQSKAPKSAAAQSRANAIESKKRAAAFKQAAANPDRPISLSKNGFNTPITRRTQTNPKQDYIRYFN